MLRVFSFPGFEAPTQGDDDDDVPELIDQTDDEPSDPAFDHLPDDMSCFAHTVQLVVKDGHKSADQLTKVLRKQSTIVSAYVRLHMLPTC